MLTRDAFQTIYDQGGNAVFALVSTFQEQIALHYAALAAEARGQIRLSVLVEARFEGKCRRLLQLGWKANPPPLASGRKRRGRGKQSTARNLLARLE